MKTNSRMGKITSYLKELTIVIIGVLIALIISNFKENDQARKYQIASIETIKNEVETNYSSLKRIIENHTRLLDSINKHSNDDIQIGELIQNVNGLQMATLSHTGLDFYRRNQINSIDFEMMSMLISEKSISELIGIKAEKLMDFLYPNLFDESEQSKMLFMIYLQNVIESEYQLMNIYENFTNEYIKTTHNK